MKMKKLLAGVMSAAMVATMIPASMAFSVSAAPEDSLVASYDLTTDTGREGWVAGGVAAGNITTDENGVTFNDGYVEQNQSYSIANPLNGKAAEGFSVALTVTVPAGAYVNAYESMFNFNGTAAQTNAVFNISGNGGGAHYNDWAANYWDITSGAAVDLSQGSIFVLTVDAEDNITLYSNGEVVNTFNSSRVSHTGTPGTVADLVNGMSNFSLGAAPALWGQPAMTVSAVSFYSSTLSAEDVASLGAYEPPVVEPDAITASVVDTTAAESYDVGDTFTVDVTAAGNVDLGGYQFTLKYDNTVLEPVLPDDSSDPDVTVSNDGENGIVALKVDLNGENTMVLGEEAITLFSLDFEVIAAPEAGSTELTLADTVFAYYDASGAVQAYDLVPTLNGCTVAIAGTVTYSPYDYNTDGNVDVNDLMALAQMIVNEDTFEDASFTYDVNEDTTVDVLDVMTLAQMIVNEEV